MLRTHLDRRMLARFGNLRDPAATGFRSMYAAMARSASSSRIATLLNRPSKNAPHLVFPICQPRQRLLQAFHEPTDALQSLASRRHPRGVLEPPLNPIIGNRQRLPGFIARWERAVPNVARPPRPTNPRRPPGRAEAACEDDYPSPKSRRRRLRRSVPVLRAGTRSNLYGRAALRPARSAAHAARDAVVAVGHRSINQRTCRPALLAPILAYATAN